MKPSSKSEILKEFQTMPGVGKSIAEDLWAMGFRSTKDLKGRVPEKLYDQLNKLVGHKTDLCMLYTFRCMVYFVNENHHDPKLLKWWAWSDENLQKRRK